MRSLMLSLLLAGQLAFAAQPALAAEADPGEQSRMGMFGGVQLRLPFGGPRAEAPRAGLMLAPTMRSQRIDGAAATRVGQGLELSFGARNPELRLAGTRLDRLGALAGPDGRRANITTLGWVGIGAGALALTLGAAYLWFDEAMDCDADEECN